MENALTLKVSQNCQFEYAGLFVSRGSGIHATRTIDTWELIFVRSGTLHMHEEGRPFAVEAGQTLLLHPGRVHGGTQSYSPDLSFFWLHFQLQGQRGASSHKQTMTIPQHGRPARPDRLTELLRHLLDDKANRLLTPITGQALLMLILHEASQTQGDGASSHTPIPPLASQAELYIAKYAHKPISTSSIARALGCNPDYLGQLYRRTFGVTITDAIMAARVKDARQMLCDQSMNINQVAQLCGFHTPGYFRRVFVKHEGMTPGRYRRLHQRMHIVVR
jgi:AraC-like DNA-binding protein